MRVLILLLVVVLVTTGGKQSQLLLQSTKVELGSKFGVEFDKILVSLQMLGVLLIWGDLQSRNNLAMNKVFDSFIRQ